MNPEDHDATETLVLALARDKGWTPAEVRAVLNQVQAPLEGFRTCVYTAEMLLRVADDEMNLARRAMFGGTGTGPELHHSFDDFDPENKEGELRRKWADKRRTNHRMILAEARRSFAQATHFQALLGEVTKPVGALVDDAEETEEQRTEREKAEELTRRLQAFAEDGVDSVTNREQKALRRRIKNGREFLADREEEAAEMMAEVPPE